MSLNMYGITSSVHSPSFQNQAFCDVIFVARGVCIQAHKVCLLGASSIFEELFLSDLSSPPAEIPKSNSASRLLHRANSINGNATGNGSKVDNAHAHARKESADTTKLLDFEEVSVTVCLSAHACNKNNRQNYYEQIFNLVCGEAGKEIVFYVWC